MAPNQIDQDALAAWCASVALFYEAEAALHREGVVEWDEKENRRRRSPWLLVRRDALNEMHRLGMTFGLTKKAAPATPASVAPAAAPPPPAPVAPPPPPPPAEPVATA